MAEKLNFNSSTFNIPGEGYATSDPDGLASNTEGVSFAIYGKNPKREREYINKNHISKETAAEAENLRIRLQGIGHGALESLKAAA